MVVDVLQLILDMVISALSFDIVFMPILVMGIFAVVIRLLLRRFN